MVHCGSCGISNPEGSSFCNKCGKPLGVLKSVSRPAQDLRERPKSDLPEFLQGALVLRPAERAVRTLCGVTHVERDGNGQSLDLDIWGYLVITSQRALFMMPSGAIRKSYSVVIEVPLEGVRGITFKDGLLTKRLVIGHAQKGNSCALKIDDLKELRGGSNKAGEWANPENVQRMLNSLAQARLHEIEREKQRSRIQYVLDFSFLKAEMEKGGVIVQTIKCPACGAGISLPSSGTSARCPYCGSMVYAHDVFEKMRGLIGGI